MRFKNSQEIIDLVRGMSDSEFDVLRAAVQEREQLMINAKRKATGLYLTQMSFEMWMKLRDKQGKEY